MPMLPGRGVSPHLNMEPHKVYNVKRGIWHTHVCREDALVLIVENVDTTAANSPKIELGEGQKGEIRRLTAELWP